MVSYGFSKLVLMHATVKTCKHFHILQIVYVISKSSWIWATTNTSLVTLHLICNTGIRVHGRQTLMCVCMKPSLNHRCRFFYHMKFPISRRQILNILSNIYPLIISGVDWLNNWYSSIYLWQMCCRTADPTPLAVTIGPKCRPKNQVEKSCYR